MEPGKEPMSRETISSTASDSGLRFSAHSHKKNSVENGKAIYASEYGTPWITDKDSPAQGEVYASRPDRVFFLLLL